MASVRALRASLACGSMVLSAVGLGILGPASAAEAAMCPGPGPQLVLADGGGTCGTAAGATAAIRGTVTSTSGAAAAGASVTLVAWPSADYLDALAVGDTVPTVAVATTTTASDGSYSFSPDFSALGSDYLSTDGAVNLDIEAVVGATMQQWSTVSALPGSIAAQDDASAGVTGVRTSQVNFDLETATVAESAGPSVDSETVPTASGSAAVSAQPSGTLTSMQPSSMQTDAVPDDPIPPGCTSWSDYKFWGKRQEKFLNLYTFSGSTEVSESNGSSHSLGVGINVGSGGWSADGSMTLEKHTSSSGSDDFTGNEQLSNYVNMHQYERSCWGVNYSGYHTEYEVRSTSFNSYLAVRTHIINRSWNINDCVYYHSGHYTKSQGSNQNFSTGLSAPYISLHAEASFTHDTTVTWSPGSAGEELCGSTSAGWASAPFAGGEAYPATGCGAPSDVPGESDDGDAVTASDVSPDC